MDKRRGPVGDWTNRQIEYYATLRRLCNELGRPVTVEEVAAAEGVVRTAARRVLNEFVYQNWVVWCRKGYRKYYWPRGWRPQARRWH